MTTPTRPLTSPYTILYYGFVEKVIVYHTSNPKHMRTFTQQEVIERLNDPDLQDAHIRNLYEQIKKCFETRHPTLKDVTIRVDKYQH